MASLGMKGPHSLTAKKIDEVVTKTSPGNYALGRSEGSTFYVRYVGRSDEDLNGRLKEWVNSKYPKFKYAYASSPKAAFEKECNNFHDFGGTSKLDNKNHPQRPDGTAWKCPRCSVYG